MLLETRIRKVIVCVKKKMKQEPELFTAVP